MFEYSIDNMFVMFGGRVFQQTTDILMGTNRTCLLDNLVLYSYGTCFIQGPLQKNEDKIADP